MLAAFEAETDKVLAAVAETDADFMAIYESMEAFKDSMADYNSLSSMN